LCSKKKTDIDVRNNKVDLVLTGQIALSPATGRQLLGQQKFTSFPDAWAITETLSSSNQSFYPKPSTISEANSPRTIPV